MSEEYTMTGPYARSEIIREGRVTEIINLHEGLTRETINFINSFGNYIEADRCIRISHIIPRINTSKVRAIARTKQRTLRARKEKMNNYRTITTTKNRFSR